MIDQEATMPEQMTLAEAMSLYKLTAFYDNNLWTVGVIHLISPHDPSRYSHSWQPVATGATWMEAVSAAVRQKVVERDDKAELVRALRIALESLAVVAVFDANHDPHFMPALSANNEADAEELTRAYWSARDALAAVGEET